jgi:antitoxin component of MazEF toxin-antitoxin module
MHITKLTRIGNSTGVTIPREILIATHLDRGDEVSLNVVDGKIEIAKASDGYNRAMAVGRAFNTRYRRAMAILAK